MLYIDERYATRLSGLVRNYKNVKPGHYNFSCPICGDSQKKTTKARGYLYPNKNQNSLVYKCHNCGVTCSLSNLFKQCFPSIHREYTFEKFKGKRDYVDSGKVTVKVFRNTFKPLEGLQSLRVLPEDNIAVKYANSRLIPKDKHRLLYYTDDFASTVNKQFPNRYPNLPKNDIRLVIPFFDLNGNVVGMQGRALLDTEDSLRYITVSAEDNAQLTYNINNINMNEQIYIVEGPIDSLFLPNCLAAVGSNLEGTERKLGKALNNTTFIFDNEKRNKEICAIQEKTILKMRNVCIWPSSVKHKDINDMILAGMSQKSIVDLISENTFSGATALLKFKTWRK